MFPRNALSPECSFAKAPGPPGLRVAMAMSLACPLLAVRRQVRGGACQLIQARCITHEGSHLHCQPVRSPLAQRGRQPLFGRWTQPIFHWIAELRCEELLLGGEERVAPSLWRLEHTGSSPRTGELLPLPLSHPTHPPSRTSAIQLVNSPARQYF